tara:strand:+ start:61 stop:303 length:243 start_codon:yes stop_codon:yes gene_type:complete
MSAAKHHRVKNGKIVRSNREWKKQRNVMRALKQWATGKKRENKHNNTAPPVRVEDMPKSIKSNFELDPDMYTGGETKEVK